MLLGGVFPQRVSEGRLLDPLPVKPDGHLHKILFLDQLLLLRLKIFLESDETFRRLIEFGNIVSPDTLIDSVAHLGTGLFQPVQAFLVGLSLTLDLLRLAEKVFVQRVADFVVVQNVFHGVPLTYRFQPDFIAMSP